MLRQLFDLFRPERADTGALAERFAAEWLERERDFHVVARNWRNPRDEREELDLVCRDAGVLVFVEVKARAADALVPGYFAVDARKKRALLRACQAYLAGLRPPPRTFRFDVVEVGIPRTPQVPGGAPGADTAEPSVLHFENVPLFSKRYQG